VGTRCADHVTPLYPQKLALTSPTGGGRSVSIVRVRTKATECVCVCVSVSVSVCGCVCRSSVALGCGLHECVEFPGCSSNILTVTALLLMHMCNYGPTISKYVEFYITVNDGWEMVWKEPALA